MHIFAGAEKARSSLLFYMEIEQCDMWRKTIGFWMCVTAEGVIRNGSVRQGDSLLFDIAGLTYELTPTLIRVYNEELQEFEVVHKANKGQD